MFPEIFSFPKSIMKRPIPSDHVICISLVSLVTVGGRKFPQSAVVFWALMFTRAIGNEYATFWIILYTSEHLPQVCERAKVWVYNRSQTRMRVYSQYHHIREIGVLGRRISPVLPLQGEILLHLHLLQCRRRRLWSLRYTGALHLNSRLLTS